MIPMKTLTIGGVAYEIVDEVARAGNAKFDDNITGGSANDTVTFWIEKGPGYCWISELDQVIDQPVQHGFLISYASETDVFQIFRDQHTPFTYYRSGDNVNGWFQNWTRVLTAPSTATGGDVLTYDEEFSSWVASKPSGASKNTWYGTCDAAANSVTRNVTTTTGDFKLETGNIVCVYFVNAMSAQSIMLNVDSTGSKSTSSVSTGDWVAGTVVSFVYDASKGQFKRLNWTKASTSNTGVVKLSSSTSSTSTTLAATPSAVKAAYDLANTANTAASEANTAAQQAQSTATSAAAAVADKAPMYTYGTEDLTAGTSPLESGKLYFVYE